jgi:hypothetical protein
MSSPAGRLPNQKSVSPYAPKWARDLHEVSRMKSRAHAVGGNDIDVAPPADANFVAEDFPNPPSLEPSLVPEPPMSESWRQRRAQFRTRDDDVTRMFLRLFFVIFFAALVAFLFVLILPVSQNLLAKRQAAIGPLTKHDDNASTPSARLPAMAGKLTATVPADRSGLSPSREEAQNAYPQDSAATRANMPPLEGGANSVKAPVRPNTESVSTFPENSLPPATAQTRSDAVESASHTPTVPALSIKTIPITREEPARPLGPNEIETLLKQGQNFVSVGDFASARVVFGRIAEARDARGALALAATYDPIVLGRIGAKGATPNVGNARQWYRRASELGSRDANARLAALANSAEVVVPAGKTSVDEVVARNSPSNDSTAPTESYWQSGESIMRLEATGNSRRFVYFRPSDAELKAGAKPGSLRFDGQISGKGYVGTAFLYSDKCGQSAFQVSGQIKNDGGRVVLSGKSLDIDKKCSVVGKTEQTFVFDFIKPPPK